MADMDRELRALAEMAMDADGRGESVGRDQAIRDWENAGGVARFSSAGNPLYRRADGRAIRSRDEAMRSYCEQ
jgi:hypothetical protein